MSEKETEQLQDESLAASRKIFRSIIIGYAVVEAIVIAIFIYKMSR
jgi:hypothetical protein